MKFLAYCRSFAARLFRHSQVQDDMEEELRSHIEHRADDLERFGLHRGEAERRARIEFGGRERYREEIHETLGGNSIDTLIQDVRFSLRVLRKSPGFTIVAVLTLALAIGANAVVFGVLNGLVLRPLNVPQAQDLFMIEGQKGSGLASYPDYLDLRDRNRSFDGLAAITMDLAALDTGDSPAPVWIVEASGNYFDVLHIQPHLGRFFHASDEQGPNSAPYIVLSYAYWQNHFPGDHDVLGRVVYLNKHPFTIVGVAPPGFHGTLLAFFPDIFLPLVNQEQVQGENFLNARGNRSIHMVMGHLKSGATRTQAVDDLKSIGSYLEKNYPAETGPTAFTLARPGLYGNLLGPPIRAFATGLMLLAVLILLAACANLGSLFAARAADRSREVALRLALGATRTRILQTVFTEAVLIAIAGGAFGLWGTFALLHGLSAWRPLSSFPLGLPVDPDATVYRAAVVLALASAILFGLVPARQVLRVDSYQIIKAGPSGTVGLRTTARDLLLAAQIAICAVLVTSSIVAIRGLAHTLQSNFGFEPRNAIVMDTALNLAGYRGETVPPMQRRMINALEALPGVESVGLIGPIPPLLYGGGLRVLVFAGEATDLRPAAAVVMSEMFSVSPEYLRAAGTALLAGRNLTWHDDEGSPRVAVVNREFARKVFGSTTNPVGGYYKMRDGTRIQVAGIVEDGKYISLTEDLRPAMFVPILQSPSTGAWLVVRSNHDLRQLAPALKSALLDLDRGLPVDLRPWETRLDLVLFPSRMATFALGVLGLMGAMLSVTGLFGMAAYSVSKRMKELGIRVTLGAQRKEVLQAALGRAFTLLAIGSTTGLLLGILAGRVVSFIVYQATPHDPLVLAGVVLAMLLLGLLATWIPARRALSINPLDLLREE